MADFEGLGKHAIAKLQRWLARWGYAIEPILPDAPEAFDGRGKALPLKLAERLARAETQGWFESPEETTIQCAAARFIGDAKRIVCVGPGVGTFERFVSVDASLEILGLLPDPEHLAWCRRENAAPNVAFRHGSFERVLEEEGRFDLALALDVLDRESDFAGFLASFSRLSDRAVVTAHNRARDIEALTSHRPRDPHRVREWTAGEFYWVMRTFYPRVELLGLQDPTVPDPQSVGLFSKAPALLALCER